MTDINGLKSEAPIQLARDEHAAGIRALQIIDLVVFLYRRTGRSPVEASGHSVDTLIDLIEDQVQTANSCLTPR